MGQTPGLEISCNASASEFSADGFVERVRGHLESTGFDPRRLEIEVTETAILQHDEDVLRTMKTLKAMGVRVALDDFGAGYSSLLHLRKFPFDTLKIDRAFVVACTEDVQSAAIVHAVISVGRAMGMKVVAEGVETDAQFNFLRVAGVHKIQGFLFSRPLPLERMKAFLRQNSAPAAGAA
jgi:EAL domain-containing protein (putative c-di-GMP-specific phosphodiesterase class I)